MSPFGEQWNSGYEIGTNDRPMPDAMPPESAAIDPVKAGHEASPPVTIAPNPDSLINRPLRTPFSTVAHPLDMMTEAVRKADTMAIYEIAGDLSPVDVMRAIVAKPHAESDHDLPITKTVFDQIGKLNDIILFAKKERDINDTSQPIEGMRNFEKIEYGAVAVYFSGIFEDLAIRYPDTLKEHKEEVLKILPMIVRQGYAHMKGGMSFDPEKDVANFPGAGHLYYLIEEELDVPKDFGLDGKLHMSEAAIRINALLEYGSPKAKAFIKDMLQGFVDISLPTASGFGKEYFNVRNLLEECRSMGLIALTEEVESVLPPMMESRFGLKKANAMEIVKSWEGAGGMSAADNIRTMKQIEESHEGGVRLLNEHYEICEFHRYPAPLLVRQVEIHGQDVPYGAILVARSDYNNAFDENKPLYSDLSKALGNKCDIRIFEVSHRLGILRSLVKLRNMYPNRKISFGMLGGHGGRDESDRDKDNITLGNGKGNRLTLGDIEKSTAKESIRDIFDPDASIILNSCSMGSIGSIGEQLSKNFNTVQGPQIPASIKSINVTFENGKPVLHATYAANGSAEDIRGKLAAVGDGGGGSAENQNAVIGATYKSGQRI